MTKKEECLKALQCLYLEVDATIADDVKRKVLDALDEANKNFVLADVMQSLPEAKQKAMEAFIEVCNEPLPEGTGKEYLNAMIKMKAFMAGRCFEYEKAKGNVA